MSNNLNNELLSFVSKKIGRLTVLERVDDAINPNGKRAIRYKCVCDCGNQKIIRKVHLASGKTLSCGCLYDETRRGRYIHGGRHDKLYSVWLNMKDRCNNPNNNRYNSYGGRGIIVCDEWLNNYEKFKEWCLNNGYHEAINPSGRNNITIDRIDVNGNYEPDNCRFVTNRENCLNKRNTMTDMERYNVCPVCGKQFVQLKRNGQQTCSVSCGQVLRIKKYVWGR